MTGSPGGIRSRTALGTMISYIKSIWNRHFSNPQVVILVLFLVGFTVTILWLGQILAPVLAAVVLAYLLDGIVTRVTRWKVRRSLAAPAVFLVFLAAMLLVILLLAPLVYRQGVTLVQQWPMMISELEQFILQLPERFPEAFSEQQVKDWTNSLREGAADATEFLLRGSVALVPSLVVIVVYFIIVPFLTFFFVLDKEKILNWLEGFLPSERQLSAQVWAETNRQLANYIRGKFWEILIVGGASYLAYLILGLNFSILLAVFTGLSVLVPWLGATLMTFPLALVAYFQFGVGWELVTTLVVYFILQAFDANVLVPILFSKAVSIHPAAIIVAVLFFGGIWGFWGVFFSIPLATLVNAVLQAWPKQPEREAVRTSGEGAG